MGSFPNKYNQLRIPSKRVYPKNYSGYEFILLKNFMDHPSIDVQIITWDKQNIVIHHPIFIIKHLASDLTMCIKNGYFGRQIRSIRYESCKILKVSIILCKLNTSFEVDELLYPEDVILDQGKYNSRR